MSAQHAAVFPLAEVRKLRSLAALLRGETVRRSQLQGVRIYCFNSLPDWELAQGIVRGLARAVAGDRYHYVYTKRGVLIVRLRAGSLRTLGLLPDPRHRWFYALEMLASAAPSLWGGSIKEDRPLPRQRYRHVVTATRGGIPAELRFKPRSRVKFACEAPANEVHP